MLALDLALISERGGRPHNEDACGHWNSLQQLCCVVADGAGGHGGGEAASRLAVTHLLQSIADQPPATAAELSERLLDANRAVREAREPGTEREQMYTTVVCLVVDFAAHSALWAHAGDTRLYRFRQGRMIERTRDHSLVQSLVDAGLLPPDDARTHPQRSELRSALGGEDRDTEISDCGPARDIGAGDAFLLCTDGIWEHVSDQELERMLAAASSPDDWLDAIEAAVREATQNRRSHDNFTALAVWASDADPHQEE